MQAYVCIHVGLVEQNKYRLVFVGLTSVKSVKQGYTFSLVLFCIYLGGLLSALHAASWSLMLYRFH